MAEINLGGSVGVAGAPILGSISVQITGDSDLTLSPLQYTNNFIRVSSDGTSTGIRKVIAPLVQGFYLVKNNTSEGYPILFIGPTGQGVQIPINVTALVNSDGTDFTLPNANSSNSAPVDAGAIDFTGQPIINNPDNGTHLQVLQDNVGSVIDGTYSDGSLPWHSGVWCVLGHSVVRVPGTDNTRPVLRIPLPPLSGCTTSRPQWNKITNRLYLIDNSIPRIFVIDTTPQVDASGSYVGGCPGIIQTIDLSSTALSAFAGQQMVLTADIANNQFRVFVTNQTIMQVVNFSGAGLATYTLSESINDAVYANGHVWASTYDGSFNQHLSGVTPTGSLVQSVLINTISGAPYANGHIVYDANNNLLWAVGNDSIFFGTSTIIGAVANYNQSGPPLTVSFTWTFPGSTFIIPVVTQNGEIGIYSPGVNSFFAQDGTQLGTFTPIGNGVGPSNLGSGFWTLIYDPITPQQRFFGTNNATGFLLSGILDVPTVSLIGTNYEFLGGVQQWVQGGGGTSTPQDTSFALVNSETIILESDLSASAYIPFAGTIPSSSGTTASLVAGPNSDVEIDGISGLLPYMLTGGAIGTITITNAVDPLNNGTFPVISSISPATPTSLEVRNFNPGVLPDINNGLIHWSIKYGLSIFLSGFDGFGPKILDFTNTIGIQNLHVCNFTSGDGTQTVDLLPFLLISPILVVAFDGTNPYIVQPLVNFLNAPFTELIFVSGIESTSSSAPIRIGARKLNSLASVFPASVGALNRTFYFIADIEATAGTASIELYNITFNTLVATLTTTNTSNTEVQTLLTLGSDGFNDNCAYEVDIFLTGGSPSDTVVCTNARIVVTYQ